MQEMVEYTDIYSSPLEPFNILNIFYRQPSAMTLSKMLQNKSQLSRYFFYTSSECGISFFYLPLYRNLL